MAIFSDAIKFLTKKSTILAIAFVVILFGLYTYSNSKSYIMDRMSSNGSNDVPSTQLASPSGSIASPIVTPQTLPNGGAGYNNRDIANPSDLLPKDTNSEWAKLNPVNSDKVIGSDLLDSSAFMGQVSQYRGIANYDIRAQPVIAKQEVSPWMQSAIEPDMYQIGLKVAN